MGREVRRVALGFDWPLDVPYEGFVRPDDLEPTTCRACDGSGLSPVGQELHDRWWGHVPFAPEETGSRPFTPETPEILNYARRKIADSRAFYDGYLGSSGEETVRREAARLCGLWNRLWQHHLSQADVDVLLASDEILDGLTHRWCGETRSWARIDRSPPTREEVNLWGLGRQGGLVQVPAYAIQTAEAARRGASPACAACAGEGSTFLDDDHRRASEDWRPTPPPEGPGWQLWETVSEGSPISPVCETPEALARHMAHEDVVRDDGMGYDGWLKFITGPGWSPTGFVVDGVGMPGHQIALQD